VLAQHHLSLAPVACLTLAAVTQDKGPLFMGGQPKAPTAQQLGCDGRGWANSSRTAIHPGQATISPPSPAYESPGDSESLEPHKIFTAVGRARPHKRVERLRDWAATPEPRPRTNTAARSNERTETGDVFEGQCGDGKAGFRHVGSYVNPHYTHTTRQWPCLLLL